jgi:hypothetical protein
VQDLTPLTFSMRWISFLCKKAWPLFRRPPNPLFTRSSLPPPPRTGEAGVDIVAWLPSRGGGERNRECCGGLCPSHPRAAEKTVAKEILNLTSESHRVSNTNADKESKDFLSSSSLLSEVNLNKNEILKIL